MPHGGGGGSAGGGFHGGSHGGSGSGTRISHTYFAGASRYRYKKRDGSYEYVYMTKAPTKSDIQGLIVLTVMIVGMFLFADLAMLVSYFQPPKKYNGSFETPSSHIQGQDYLDNTEGLEESLEEFEKKTGICPIVFAVYNEQWQTSYKDLEDYAYDLYVDNYDDEEHFVVVYSIGYGDAGNWYWETMIGDDVDGILTSNRVKTIGKGFQYRLESGMPPGEAMAETFDYAADYLMKSDDEVGESKAPFVFMGFIALFTLVIMVFAIKNYSKKYEKVDKFGNPVDTTDDQAQTKTAIRDYEQEKKIKNATGSIVVLICSLLFVPFIIIGLKLIIEGIDALASGSGGIPFKLIMGVIWNGILVVAFISFIKRIRNKNKKGTVSPDPDVRKAEQRAAETKGKEPEAADYPEPEAMDKPAEEKMNAFEKAQVYDESLIDAALNRESHVDYDDEDYKRMKQDGYE